MGFGKTSASSAGSKRAEFTPASTGPRDIFENDMEEARGRINQMVGWLSLGLICVVAAGSAYIWNTAPKDGASFSFFGLGGSNAGRTAPHPLYGTEPSGPWAALAREQALPSRSMPTDGQLTGQEVSLQRRCHAEANKNSIMEIEMTFNKDFDQNNAPIMGTDMMMSQPNYDKLVSCMASQELGRLCDGDNRQWLANAFRNYFFSLNAIEEMSVLSSPMGQVMAKAYDKKIKDKGGSGLMPGLDADPTVVQRAKRLMEQGYLKPSDLLMRGYLPKGARGLFDDVVPGELTSCGT